MSKGKTFLPPKPMESMPMPTETAGIDATANSNPGSASSKKKRRGRPKKWSRTATAAKAGNKSKKKRYQPTGRPVGRPRKSITPVRDDASAFAPLAGATSETDPRVPRHHSPEFYRPKTAVKNEEEEGQDELLADEELAEAKLNAVAGYSEEIILPSATAAGASATSAMVCTPYTSQDVLMDQFFDTPVPVFYYQPVLPQCANENADNIHLNHPQGRLPFQPLPPPPIPPPNQPGKYVYYRRFIPDDPKALSSKDAKHTAAAANASLKENMHPNVAPTPVKRKRGRPPKSASKKAALVSASSFAATPKSNGKAKSRFATSTTPRSGSRSSIRVKSKSSSPFSISNTNISSFASLSNSNSSSGKITRRTACGTCAVCTQQDCRKCKYCKDMKRYGGPQKLKQKCIMRGSCPFANVENPYFCRRTSHDDGAGGVIDTDGNYCVVVVNGVDAGRCVDSSLGNGGSVGNASSGGGATDFSGSGHAEEVAAETTVESAGNSSNVNKMNRDGNDADDADSDYDQSQDEDEDDDDDDDDDEYFPGKKNKNDAPKKRVKIEADEFVALKSQALAAITISAVGPRNELDNSTANANSLGPSIPKDDTNLNRQATAEIETDENPMRNLEEDCRKCRYCLDMTRYGGPGKLKQRCQYKRRRPLKSKNLNHAANTLDSASKKKGSTGGAFVATPSGLTIRASRRHIKKEDVKAANEVFGRYMKSYASIMSVDNGKTSPDSSSLKDIMSHRIPRKKSTAKERSTHPAGHASESSIQSKNFATTAANDGGSSSTEGSFRKQSPARVSNKSSFVTPISTVKTTKSSLQIRIGQSSKNTSTAAADTKSISESSSSPNNAKLGTTLAPTTSKTSDKKFIETPTTWNPERVDCNGMTLPEIVFALVCDASQNFSHVLHWTEDGDAFYVDETHEELELLVGKYFKHGKFNSLKRQLYLYGWRKQKGVYTNPRFHRDLTKVDDLKKIGKGFWRHDASCPNADEILMIDSAKSKVASDDSEPSVPLNRSVLKRKAFSHACSSIKNVLCGEGKLDPVLEDEDEGDETDRAQEYTNEYEEAKSLLQLRSTPNHEHDDIDDTLSFEPTQSESWLPGESEDKCSEAKDTAMNTIESSKPTDESVTFPADIATTPNPIQSRYSDPLDGNIMSTAEYEREVMEMGPVFEFSPYPDVGTNRLDALVNMAELVDRAGSSRVKALPIRPPQFATRPQFSPIVLPSSQEKPPKPASVATSTDYSAREEPEQLAVPHVIASPSKIQTSNNVDDVQLSWKSTGTFTLGALEAMPEELPSLTADDRA